MAWRDSAKPIIAQVLKDTKGQPEKAIRKALKEAYPFGMRKYHPYKIWLSEIQDGYQITDVGKRVLNENTPYLCNGQDMRKPIGTEKFVRHRR